MMGAVHHQQPQQQIHYSQTLGKQHDHSSIPGVHMNRQQQQQQQQMQNQTVYGSPQRRFLSEGELVRQGAELSYARSNNTTDNIRELASSPQHGVYMWKDNSPGYNGNQPTPQFPGAQNQLNNMNMNEYISRGPAPMHIQSQQQSQQMQQQQQHYIPNNMQHDYGVARHKSNPTSPVQQHSNDNNAQRLNQVSFRVRRFSFCL